jgi:hypothetical protein
MQLAFPRVLQPEEGVRTAQFRLYIKQENIKEAMRAVPGCLEQLLGVRKVSFRIEDNPDYSSKRELYYAYIRVVGWSEI